MSGSRTGLILCTILVVGISCAPAGVPPAGGASTPSGAASQPPGTSATLSTGPRELPLAVAWPNVHPRSVATWKVLPGDLAFLELAPTPDGKYRIGFTMLPFEVTGQADERRDVVLLEDGTNAITVLHRFQSPLHQMLFADADDRWVVWSEGSLQPSFEDWTIFAYDRVNAKLARVAAAATGSDGRAVPGHTFVQPKVDRGRLVWSAATAQVPLGEHVDSFIADLAAGTTKILTHDAVSAGIAWPIAVVGHRPADATHAARFASIDLETGAETDLGIDDASYVAVSGHSVSWIDATLRAVFLANLQTGEKRTLVDYRSPDPHDGPRLQFLSLSDRLVTWDQRPTGSVPAAGARAYDRKLDILVDLSDCHVTGASYLKGSTLDWFDGHCTNDQPRTATITRTVDTSGLP